MITIWKYQFDLIDFQTIEMPADAQIISAGMQRDIPVLWAIVDDDKATAPVPLWVVGTGQTMPREIASSGCLIDTLEDGAFIWHVFTTTGYRP